MDEAASHPYFDLNPSELTQLTSSQLRATYSTADSNYIQYNRKPVDAEEAKVQDLIKAEE